MPGDATTPFDLIVVGGGIVGTGVARDAARRGLRVALFEKEDFGYGTTGRSTRLIHGGLRYLEHLELPLVHEALRERRRLIRNAPHLVTPLPFLYPLYRGRGRPLPLLWAGMLLYDVLSLRKHLPHHRLLAPTTVHKLEPALRTDRLRGGFLFYDAQCAWPERLCVENVLDAAAQGARVANHAEVVGLLRDGGRLLGVRVRHALSGEEEDVHGRVVVNAAGPWVDALLQRSRVPGGSRVRRSKGIHLVVPRFTHHALIMDTRDARRIFFAIPWEDYTLLGTTDTEFAGDNDAVRAEEEDIEYVLKEANDLLEGDLGRDRVLFTTAGLRALPRVELSDVGGITRRHVIHDHGREGGPGGLFSVVGGKITTYRATAEDVVDRVQRWIGQRVEPSATHRTPLPGGAKDWPTRRKQLVEQARAAGLSEASAGHVVAFYGVRAEGIIHRVLGEPELAVPIVEGRPEVLAEVDVAVDEELARTAEDVLMRRTRLGLSRGVGLQALPAVLERMARRLGWDEARRRQEAAAYRARAAMLTPRIDGDGPV